MWWFSVGLQLDPELPFDLELDPLLGLELPLRRLDPLLELPRLGAASHNSTVTRTMERIEWFPSTSNLQRSVGQMYVVDLAITPAASLNFQPIEYKRAIFIMPIQFNQFSGDICQFK